MRADLPSPPPLAPVPPALKSRRRLKGAAIGLVIGAVLGTLLCLINIIPADLQVRRNAPRLAAFNQQCAHPVIGNPTTFDHAKAGQNACEAFPAVVRKEHFHPYHDQDHWQYWLSIGNQTLKDEDGREKSGNPEAIGYATASERWENGASTPVYALFWKGVLMSIYSRKDGYAARVQTVSNPSTAGHDLGFWSSEFSIAYPVLTLIFAGVLVGYGVVDKKIQTDEEGPSASDKANAERLALPLPSDEATLQATGRKAVWSLQGMFFALQAVNVGLFAVTYSQALHPPKFAVPTPAPPPNLLLIWGAVGLGVFMLGAATFAVFRSIKLRPPFPKLWSAKARAFNAMGLAHLSWAPLLYATTATHNLGFFVAGTATIWIIVQLLLMPRYRAFWRAALEEVRAQKSLLKPAN